VLFYSKSGAIDKSFKRKFNLITGLRAEQSEKRSDLSLLNTMKFEIIKFNPLLKWTLKGVLFRKKQCAAKYFTQAGICSIGCAPCTRAISEDEDIRPEDGGGSRVTKSADYIKISC
jgi:phosphoadenosine phosphosulfate reductase